MKLHATENCKVVSAVLPASYSAAAEAFSSGIDCQGFTEALIIFHLGVFTATGDVSFQVEDSDDNSTFADIDLDSDSTDDGVTQEFVQADDENVYVGRIDLSRVKRYIRVGYDVDDDDAIFGVTVVLMGYKYPPVTQVNTVEFDVKGDE